MTLLQGLPPIENPDARVLILGSMPGGASLRAGRYYAHPQNLFWPLMGEFVGADPALDYASRVARLREAGVALWDVIGECEREGSLDSAIRGAVANDFRGFFAAHRQLRAVLFNGAKAADTFARKVPAGALPDGVQCIRLPSTSPANRSQANEAKRAAWREALHLGGARLR